MKTKLSVIHLVLDTGERLPCLVDAETWLPKRVATRWAVRQRRYRVQASTLASNLRMLGKVYQWAGQHEGIELDDFLTAGHRLSAGQLKGLCAHLREMAAGKDDHVIRPNTYNSYLAVAENFLKWALYPENRGGVSHLSLHQLAAERSYLELFFSAQRLRSGRSPRLEPLTESEVASIRAVLAPRRAPDGQWTFPAGGFSRHTALRNWLMFETALELGVRRGELLKLRLDSLPRGAGDGIKILRHPDDPHDSRVREPAVKSAERVIPASRPLLQAIRAYITSPPPLGRVAGKSPYLFLARSGRPLSVNATNDIIQAVGRMSGVPLSWHRLRHTWAEKMAELFLEQPNGQDRLMYLGGWTNPASPQRYIQNVVARQAMATLRDHQAQLYEETAE